MVHVSQMFLSEWRELPSAPCLAGGGGITARVSMLLKSRASPDMLPFSLCNKTCNSTHEQTPLSNDTIDSVLQYQEVGRAEDLSAPPRKQLLVTAAALRVILYIYTNICSLMANKCIASERTGRAALTCLVAVM